MESNSDICMYVTSYEGEEDYYESKGFKDAEDAWNNGELDWETFIDDYSIEEELIIKKLLFNDDLIKRIEFFETPDISLIKLLIKYNIEYEEV